VSVRQNVRPAPSLPVRLTSFVGRAQEIAYLRDLPGRSGRVADLRDPVTRPVPAAMQRAAASIGVDLLELAVNVKTAEALDLNVPQSVVLLASEVVQ
jgi:hypothetical protein